MLGLLLEPLARVSSNSSKCFDVKNLYLHRDSNLSLWTAAPVLGTVATKPRRHDEENASYYSPNQVQKASFVPFKAYYSTNNLAPQYPVYIWLRLF